MSANRAVHPIATQCRVLGVSPSGYYAWRARGPSRRSQSDEGLLGRIEAIHARSQGTYGAPRIHAELREHGVCVARKRIARLMRQAGLAGVSRRKGTATTQRRAKAPPAPDLVQRDFAAERPDELYVADITYVPTWAGFLFLAVVLDACTRRVVGWSMAVNAEVNFPSCAEVKIPTFLDFPVHVEALFLGGRPRRFFGFAGAVMGGSRKFSGTSLACSLSR